ncbi:MAG: hypothetical protein RL007_126 [Bacteroidota bacterium]|jgi:acyl carrier protein
MNNEEIRNIIRGKVKDLTFVNATDDQSLLKAKLLDSIIVVDLAVELEQEFGFKIPFTEITEDNFETISSIAAYIQSRITA